MQTNQVFENNSRIGAYTLVEFIGRGTSAVVWKVRDDEDNLWAMKIFSPEHGMTVAEIEDFKNEFKRTLGLEHQNILCGIKYGEFNRRPYILFDLCTKSVGTVIKQRRPKTNQRFTEEEVALILADVSSALVYLHDRDILHQDVKPDNILVNKSLNQRDRYMLSDFGVSIQLKKTIQKRTQRLSQQRSGLSPDYAAPEQFKGQSGKKSDIFALGVTLFELCDGDTPSRSNTCTAEALMNGGYIPDIPAMYSKRLDQMIKQCMAIDPEKRPSAKEIYERTQYFLEHGYWPNKAIKPKTKNKLIAKIAIGVIGVLLLSFLGYNLILGSAENDKDQFEQLISQFQYEKAIEIASRHEEEYFKNLIPTLERNKSIINDYQIIDDQYAIFFTEDNMVGIIQKGKDIVVDPIYDDILTFTSPDIITVKKGGNCGYINIKGDWIFEGIENFNVCRNFSSVAEAKEVLEI